MISISRSRIFLYSMLAFCVGVFIAQYLSFFVANIPLAIVAIFLLPILLLLSYPNRLRLVGILFLLLASILLGIWRQQSYVPLIDESHIGYYNDDGNIYLIEGVINSEPSEKGNNFQLQISNLRISPDDSSDGFFAVPNGKVILSIPKYYGVQYGDVVQFNAKITAPKAFETFDYPSYLARFGVYSIANNPDKFQVVGDYNGFESLSRKDRAKFSIFSALYETKRYFSQTLKKIYPEPHAAFMLGLLVGEKKGLPDWLMLVFQIVGITHIIAISGYNITILAKVAEKTMGRFGRRFIFWGVLAMVISFVIMTGAQASIVRAGVMGVLLVYAGFIGRRSNAINALIFAGAVMVFLNPLILRYDAGFQLSFLATLGLVYISPIFEVWLSRIPNAVRQLLGATLAAQVLTAPIIISSFGKFSLIAPLANIIVLPFIPIAMFFGFLSCGLGMVWLPLGQIAGFFGYIILEFIIKVSEVLSRVPYASLDFEMRNWGIWSIYYCIVGAFVWVWYKRRKSQVQSDRDKE